MPSLILCQKFRSLRAIRLKYNRPHHHQFNSIIGIACFRHTYGKCATVGSESLHATKTHF